MARSGDWREYLRLKLGEWLALLPSSRFGTLALARRLSIQCPLAITTAVLFEARVLRRSSRILRPGGSLAVYAVSVTLSTIYWHATSTGGSCFEGLRAQSSGFAAYAFCRRGSPVSPALSCFGWVLVIDS